jgi:hypothetical protein
MKLLKTDMYLLLIDEEAEIIVGDYFLNPNFTLRECENLNITKYGNIQDKHEHSWRLSMCKGKVIGYYPLTKEAKELDLPLLPSFGEVDINRLAESFYREFPNNPKDKPDWTYNRDIHVHKKRKAFIDGYKAAQSKQFSLEDMKRAFEQGHKVGVYLADYKHEEKWEEFIQSLSTQRLPKSFNPEYEYLNCSECDGAGWMVSCEKCNGEGNKKLSTLKTITNSEGKEVLCGTYKY